MKKTLFKYIVAASVILTVASCEKAVEKTPTHSLTLENAFKSLDDFENSLSAAYNSLRAVGYYGRNQSVIPDMNTDNLVQTGESLVNFFGGNRLVIYPTKWYRGRNMVSRIYCY